MYGQAQAIPEVLNAIQYVAAQCAPIQSSRPALSTQQHCPFQFLIYSSKMYRRKSQPTAQTSSEAIYLGTQPDWPSHPESAVHSGRRSDCQLVQPLRSADDVLERRVDERPCDAKGACILRLEPVVCAFKVNRWWRDRSEVHCWRKSRQEHGQDTTVAVFDFEYLNRTVPRS